jgi:hypothetical protein
MRLPLNPKINAWESIAAIFDGPSKQEKKVLYFLV